MLLLKLLGMERGVPPTSPDDSTPLERPNSPLSSSKIGSASNAEASKPLPSSSSPSRKLRSSSTAKDMVSFATKVTVQSSLLGLRCLRNLLVFCQFALRKSPNSNGSYNLVHGQREISAWDDFFGVLCPSDTLARRVIKVKLAMLKIHHKIAYKTRDKTQL